MSGSPCNLFSITIISVFMNFGQDNKTANSYDCNVMVNGLKPEAFKSESFNMRVKKFKVKIIEIIFN